MAQFIIEAIILCQIGGVLGAVAGIVGGCHQHSARGLRGHSEDVGWYWLRCLRYRWTRL